MSQAYIYPSSGANTLLTLTPVGSSPNADGATLSGSTFTLQPADSTHPGVVSTAAQSFLGKKTFIDGLDAGSSVISHVADPISAQDAATKAYVDAGIGGLAIAALDSQAPNSNGLALSGDSLSSQSADATHPGMVNLTTQTFAGDKTFTGSVTANGNVTGLNLNTANQVNASNLRGNNLDSPTGNATLGIGGVNATLVDFNGIDVSNIGTLTVNANINTTAAGNLSTPNQCNAGILAADVWDSQSNGSTITMGGAGRAILISANNLIISALADPVNPQDAATKAYVDAAAGGLPSPLEAVASQSSNAGGTGPFVGVDSDAHQSTNVVLFGSTDTSTANNKTTSVFIVAGDVLAGSGNAGQVNIQGGQSQSGNAGAIVLAAGASNTGNGAGINLFAGDGSASSGTGNGGNVQIFAGGSDTAGNGGSVVLLQGQAFGAGVQGSVQIDGAIVLRAGSPQVIIAGGSIPSLVSSRQISAASAISTSSSAPIEAGRADGQILVLVNTGANTITIKAGGNTQLPGGVDYALAANGTISFMWQVAAWYCTGVSAN